jgi:hypothetical protein
MFIQVIQGKVTDPTAVRAMLDRWVDEQQPHAGGWLGSTAGVAQGGEFVCLARFDSADAARRNAERPEQGRWWAETSALFDADVTFHDCTDVEEHLGGGSDSAGFVQVMQGRTADVDRLREVSHQLDHVESWRPDLLGVVVGLHGDGGFTEAAYFTSEAEARTGEGQPAPAQAQALIEEERSLIEDLTYLDLPDPWLYSPR